MIDPRFIPALAAVTAAFLLDIRTYRAAVESARAQDRATPRFDFLLCFIRCLEGGIVGLAASFLGTELG
jgi:hypothetical protein